MDESSLLSYTERKYSEKMMILQDSKKLKVHNLAYKYFITIFSP